MFGLGKPRSRLGKWLDRHGLPQKWLEEETGLSDETISRLANRDDVSPRRKTMQRILKAIRKVDPKAKADDFWPM